MTKLVIKNANITITPTEFEKQANVSATLDVPAPLEDSTVSPKFSFKGYSFGTWFSKNKNQIKGIIVAIVSVGTFMQMFTLSNPVPVEVIMAAVGAAALATKKGLDTIDYYCSDVNLAQK